MIAVDAGAHLASIARILQRDMPPTSEKLPPAGYAKRLDQGPFAGVTFPHISAKANALYIFRELLHAFLITHPHLDHLSAMAINTPALEYGREAKAIVALPSTIEAIKTHIFNDSLWPNLSDEGHGVGFVTYRRLIEGGNPRLGSGESRGYVNVCDGLATKCWAVSHGKCNRRTHSISHQHSDSFGWNQDYSFPSRRLSRISDDHGYFAAMSQHQPQSAYPQAQMQMMNPGPVTPGVLGVAPPSAHIDPNHNFEPVNSSAFFIRNDATGHELLIFGDIEPDSVSMSPRNHIIWDDAAGKIATGHLKAIFIECSFDDSVRDADLYGHLCPRHLVAELTFLANCVVSKRRPASSGQANAAAAGHNPDEHVFVKPQEAPSPAHMSMRQPPTPADLKRKRKRPVNGGDVQTTPELVPTAFDATLSPSQPLSGSYVGHRSTSASRRKTSHETGEPSSSTFETPAIPSTPRGRLVQFQPPSIQSASIQGQGLAITTTAPTPAQRLDNPLAGVTIHLIHIKDTLLDGPSPGDVISAECKALGEEAGLGCEFNVTESGMSIWV